MERSFETIPEPISEPFQRSAAKRFCGRVLLVDDNGTNLLLGRMILESLGLTVEEAQNGAIAVEKVAHTDFDLVLMDINMPVMDGARATDAIRQKFSKEVLPVVALSAYASSEEKERCLAAGMNDYIAKPIVRDHLAQQLSQWLPGEPDEPHGSNPALKTAPAKNNEIREKSLTVQVLLDLQTQIGDAHLTTVLDQFENEVRSRWGRLSDAFAENDIVSMQRETHTLSSTCRSLGLIAAGGKFSALENSLRAGKNVQSQDLDNLERSLRQGLKELSEFRTARTG
jgi:CheY-like chemotaxis protein/HPt (histidine-containing phosphotransfer) domain-containing protein